MSAQGSPSTPRRPPAVRELVALGLAVPLAFAGHVALHIGGDQYGGGLGLIAVAAFLDWRRNRLWTRALLYATVLSLLTDWTAMRQLLAWTTGGA